MFESLLFGFIVNLIAFIIGLILFIAVLSIAGDTIKIRAYLKEIRDYQMKPKASLALQEQLAAKIPVPDIEMADYDAPEDNKGTAFCMDCRQVVPKKDLLYNRKLDTYVHPRCLVNRR